MAFSSIKHLYDMATIALAATSTPVYKLYIYTILNNIDTLYVCANAYKLVCLPCSVAATTYEEGSLAYPSPGLTYFTYCIHRSAAHGGIALATVNVRACDVALNIYK